MQYEPWNEQETRTQICEVGRRLYDLFLVAGNGGNISARLNDEEIIVTPTGVSKGLMKPEHLIKVTNGGKIISATGKFRPTSELLMHLAIYQRRADVRAIVHAHPPTATGFAVAGFCIDQPFLPELAVRLGRIALVPYVVPGGRELAESIVLYVKDYNALLMGNHGAVTYDVNLTEALFKMETVEHSSRVFMTARQIGEPTYLSSEQVTELLARFS